MALPKFVRYTLGPLGLILGCPLTVIIFNHMIQNLHGDIGVTINEIVEYGIYGFLTQRCVFNNAPTVNHFVIIFTFYISQIIIYYIVPGKITHGPPTPTGYVPLYKQNGVLAYCVNIILILIGYFIFNIPFHEIFNHLTPIIIAVCIIAWVVTFALLICAKCCPQNPADVKWSETAILSYFRGCELYPYWFGINCKQLINSRIGMTQWALICLCYILKDYDNMKQLSAPVSVPWINVICSPVFISGLLQIIYLFKFFWWEIGYFHTLDVMHDRCGYYISWGCLSWVASVYTFHTGIILSHKLYISQLNNDIYYFNMNIFNALSIFFIGIISIYINYAADMQKIRVRKANGKCNVFGKKAEIINAEYKTKDGKTKKSILLICGYWAMSRHFHYVPELIFALMICVPTQMVSFIQLFYFIYLTILLCDRTGRDDQRCSMKYGSFWKQYCHQVQYKMIPYVW